MSGKSRPHLSLMVILAALALVAGCITVPKEDTGAAGGPAPKVGTGQSDPPRPQTPVTEDPTPIEERWSCGDITLTAACWPGGDCYGKVKIGKYPAKDAQFYIVGVDRRWNWCPEGGRYLCTFVIGPRGWGSYLNFRGVPAGKKIKPSGVFKCAETRS